MNLQSFGKLIGDSTDQPQPVLFLGHGNPMNALLDTPFTRRMKSLGKELATPKAILVISAHWETKGSYVSVNPAPGTIYDFGGFPKALSEVVYPAPGSPEMARELISIQPQRLIADATMGFDHGSWTLLTHVFPDAKIPVFQLSLDYSMSPSQHFELAQSLKSIRNKGVMVIGSGNLVHNLSLLNWRQPDIQPPDWAMEFDQHVWKALRSKDPDPLIHFDRFGKAAQLSVPTPEHFLPVLYVAGMALEGEEAQIIHEGFEYSSLSMRCLRFG